MTQSSVTTRPNVMLALISTHQRTLPRFKKRLLKGKLIWTRSALSTEFLAFKTNIFGQRKKKILKLHPNYPLHFCSHIAWSSAATCERFHGIRIKWSDSTNIKNYVYIFHIGASVMLTVIGRLLYFTSILVEHSDNGRKSDRNMKVNLYDGAYFISVHVLVY